MYGPGGSGHYDPQRGWVNDATGPVNGVAPGGVSQKDPYGNPAPAPAPAASAPAAPAAPAGPQYPGLLPGTQNPNMKGLDFTQPGAAETFFGENKGAFTQPGLAQGVAERAIAAGHTPTSNDASEAFGMFKNSVPADMSSYYANAGRQGTEALDKSMSARGTYGSSAASDQESEMLGNLAADRAKAEAAYGIQRGSALSAAGSAADSSSVAGSANDRSWMTGLAGVAQGADTERLAGLTAGMSAAEGAQGAQRGRGQDYFHNNLDFGSATSDVIGAGDSQMFGNDKSLFESGVAANVAPYSEGAAQAITTRNQNTSDQATGVQNTLALAKLFKKS